MANKGRFTKKVRTPEEKAELEAKASNFHKVNTPLATAYKVAKKAIVGYRAGSNKGLIKFLYNELKELCDVRNKAEGVEDLKGVNKMLASHSYRHCMASVLMRTVDDSLLFVSKDYDLSELKEKIATHVKRELEFYVTPWSVEEAEEANADLAEVF